MPHSLVFTCEEVVLTPDFYVLGLSVEPTRLLFEVEGEDVGYDVLASVYP